MYHHHAWHCTKHNNLQIMAFMLDNTSNNDTLVDEIVKRAKEQGIYMNASWVRLRCMPHTVHLAALKVSSQLHWDVIVLIKYPDIKCSCLKELVPFPKQKARRQHLAAEITKILPQHHSAANLTILQRLKVMKMNRRVPHLKLTVLVILFQPLRR
jgi:hypothetical protein